MTNNIYSLIIDTDPGIDDAAAIFWLLSDKRFDIKAITITHGNIGVNGCAMNALRILEIAGKRDIPVYKGARKPLLKCPVAATYAHGMDGLGDTDLPFSANKVTDGWAPSEIIRIAKESSRKITILAIGPITNIAIAVLSAPDLPNYIERIVFMGGAVKVQGNITTAASFNVYSDPEAAEIVYKSGIPIVQIGLDVCNLFRFNVNDFNVLAHVSNSVAQAMVKMARFRLAQIGVSMNKSVADYDSIALNDVAAAAYLINPGWFSVEEAEGEVVMDGICRGMTLLDFNVEKGSKGNIIFAADADSQAAVSGWVSAIAGFGIKGQR